MPLQATRQQLLFFDTQDPQYAAPNLPIYIGWDDVVYYGIGSDGEGGFKCAQHGIDAPVSPDDVDRSHDPAYEGRVREFMARHIPGANRPWPKAGSVCIP